MFLIPIVQTIRRNMSKAAFYAVRNGRRKTIVTTWEECETLVKGFQNARYKKFKTIVEAEAFMDAGDDVSNPTSKRKNDEIECGTTSKKIRNDPKRGATFGFPEDEKKPSLEGPGGFAVVYTDGACSSNGQHAAKAGYGVFWGDNDPRNIANSLGPGPQTNNRAELRAVTKAIEQANAQGIKDLEIRTDSQFVINAIKSWMPKWIKNDWKLSTGKCVALEKEFKHYLNVKGTINLKLVHVKGHGGIHGNEEADRLAVEGSKKS